MSERLTLAGCVAADEEAEELIAGAPDLEHLREWVVRREHGEPLAWIVGQTSFCGQTLRVDPSLYVPRAQSEELAHRACTCLPFGGRAVDLCTGVGAVAAHLARTRPAASVVATDLDWHAVRCARRNGVRSILSDLGASLRSGCFDVVTAVPPYVPTESLRLLPADVVRYEPLLALDGGADGLRVCLRLVIEARRLLREGGWLLLEIGGDQLRSTARLLEASSFSEPIAWYDDDGDLRGVQARALDR